MNLFEMENLIKNKDVPRQRNFTKHSFRFVLLYFFISLLSFMWHLHCQSFQKVFFLLLFEINSTWIIIRSPARFNSIVSLQYSVPNRGWNLNQNLSSGDNRHVDIFNVWAIVLISSQIAPPEIWLRKSLILDKGKVLFNQAK